MKKTNIFDYLRSKGVLAKNSKMESASKIMSRQKTRTRNEELTRLHKSGLTVAQIADISGVPLSTVKQFLKSNKLKK